MSVAINTPFAPGAAMPRRHTMQGEGQLDVCLVRSLLGRPDTSELRATLNPSSPLMLTLALALAPAQVTWRDLALEM